MFQISALKATKNLQKMISMIILTFKAVYPYNMTANKSRKNLRLSKKFQKKNSTCLTSSLYEMSANHLSETATLPRRLTTFSKKTIICNKKCPILNKVRHKTKSSILHLHKNHKNHLLKNLHASSIILKTVFSSNSLMIQRKIYATASKLKVLHH